LTPQTWKNETRKRKTQTTSAAKELVRSYVRGFALRYGVFWGATRMLLHFTITILMSGKGIPAAVQNNMK
jgi:hypothetical protein